MALRPSLSDARVEDWQRRFWERDFPITKLAQSRTYYGAVMEQLTASYLGAVRLKCQAERLCPDLRHDHRLALDGLRPPGSQDAVPHAGAGIFRRDFCR